MGERRKVSLATRRDVLCLGAGAAVTGVLPHVSTAGDSMRTRIIPASGEALPVIGLGTYGVFDVGESAVERAPCRDVLGKLVSGGASLVDSSPMYRRAERVSGDLAADLDLTDRIFWATKVWTNGRDAGIDQMNASMRFFQTDQVDLMQIHNLRDWKVHIKTLCDWKERGRIRYIGITHYRVEAFEQLERVIRETGLDFVQLNFSLAERDAEDRLLPLCADKGIATLINRPYQRGGLFGKVQGRQLPEWAEEFGARSWGQFFLKYILGHPAVTCVIPATSKPKHMLDNLAAGYGDLPSAPRRKAMADYISSI